MKLLLENQGDPNVKDNALQISIHFHYAATNESNSGVVNLKLLLQYGGNSNSFDYRKSTPMHLASLNNSSAATEILKLLLKKRENPNIPGPQNMTPLHFAAFNETEKKWTNPDSCLGRRSS